MAKALYRKYRSKSLDEIVGQEHITTTLKNALKSGKISHAYLFTGPKGVGKTSIARILAHEVNGFAYDGSTHLDIIEIDAASNRRIDEIRDLRDKVHTAPTSGKYKVYIIDEVHMLTKEAFNALLKTLEEPPEHVIFILATTEVHKLPETIISRTQRFSFKPISDKETVEHLKALAKHENISIDDEALQLIASHAGGSFRDSISMLDQISSLGAPVGSNDIERMLGIAPTRAITAIIDALVTGSAKDVVARLQKLGEQGYLAAQTSHQLCQTLQAQLISGENRLEPGVCLELLDKLINVPASPDPARSLELALIAVALQNAPAKTLPAAHQPQAPISPKPKTTKAPHDAARSISQAAENRAGNFDKNQWHDILAAIKKAHNTLYSVVRMAEPVEDSETLILKFAFGFHQKQLNEARNRKMIQSVVNQVTGKNYAIECVVDKGVTTKFTPDIDTSSVAPRPESDTLNTITDIFGGGEILESS